MVRRTVRAESFKCSWSLVDDSLIDAEKFCFLSRWAQIVRWPNRWPNESQRASAGR